MLVGNDLPELRKDNGYMGSAGEEKVQGYENVDLLVYWPGLSGLAITSRRGSVIGSSNLHVISVISKAVRF